MTEILLPPDVLARVESVELQNLIAKVKNGGVLSPKERQALAKLTEKYGPKKPGQAENGNDAVPVSQDEGSVGAKPTRSQKLARVQVVGEWMCAYKTRVRICQLAASRWGIASRTADDLIAEAKRQLADPRQDSRQVFRSIQVRGLQKLIAARMDGTDARDPLDGMKELSKLLGLNEPDRAHVEQVVSAPEDSPRVQFYIPDNGRKVVASGEAGLS